MVNFWQNYENIMNWGYTMSGARQSERDELTAPKIAQMKVCIVF